MQRRQSSAQEGFYVLRFFPKCWGNLQEVCPGCSSSCLEMFVRLVSINNKPDKEQLYWSQIFHIFHRITGLFRLEKTSVITKSKLCLNTTVPTKPCYQEVFLVFFYTALEHTFRVSILESGFHVLLKMRLFSPFYLALTQTVPSSLTPHLSSHNSDIL